MTDPMTIYGYTKEMAEADREGWRTFRPYCCRGECCGPGSWCCSHAGPHDHEVGGQKGESDGT